MTDKPVERIIAPTFGPRGNPEWRSRMSPPDNSIAVIKMIPDRIIPVIFVPGVMGSNLIEKGAEPKDAVKWRLDSPTSAGEWALPWRDAVFRKRYLRPSVMQVDKGGAITGGTAQASEELTRRGWGEVGAMSYGAFLVWLENALNDYNDPHAGQRVSLMKDTLQALVGESLLSRDEVALSYKYRFPVHACGYNWLASNAESSRKLGARIDEVIRRYRDVEHNKIDKVILVTHSMGGLVARHCSEVLGYRDKIFGIVHGVMPAIGAAAVYRRFKAGTENSAANKGFKEQLEGWGATLALGRNAAQMAAVLSTAPGPLQLLPTPEYGAGWLKIKDGAQEYSLPQKGDPYGEIYAVKNKWWSMCEVAIMNPLNEETYPKKLQTQMDADWKAFVQVINEIVKVFHSEVKEKYHLNTHAFYGSHADNKAYGNVTWTGSSGFAASTLFEERPVNVPDARQLTSAELKDQRKPEFEINNTRTVDAVYTDGGWFARTQRSYNLSEPEEDGDGTVPRRSGVAAQAFCRSFLKVNVAHEPAYKHDKGADNLRACRFTLRAIVKIAQAVQETSLKYEC